jgi:hypothetical protein
MPVLTLQTIYNFFHRSPSRPILTIAALRENPWSVISHELPSNADKLLLTAAHLAVAYCGDSEYLLMRAARDGDYLPAWWDETGMTPDAHEESEELFYVADSKLLEIVKLLGRGIEESPR